MHWRRHMPRKGAFWKAKNYFFQKNGFWRLKGAFLIWAPYRCQKWKKRPIFDLELTGFVLKAPFHCLRAHLTDSGGDSWYDKRSVKKVLLFCLLLFFKTELKALLWTGTIFISDLTHKSNLNGSVLDIYVALSLL